MNVRNKQRRHSLNIRNIDKTIYLQPSSTSTILRGAEKTSLPNGITCGNQKGDCLPNEWIENKIVIVYLYIEPQSPVSSRR